MLGSGAESVLAGEATADMVASRADCMRVSITADVFTGQHHKRCCKKSVGHSHIRSHLVTLSLIEAMAVMLMVLIFVNNTCIRLLAHLLCG